MTEAGLVKVIEEPRAAGAHPKRGDGGVHREYDPDLAAAEKDRRGLSISDSLSNGNALSLRSTLRSHDEGDPWKFPETRTVAEGDASFCILIAGNSRTGPRRTFIFDRPLLHGCKITEHGLQSVCVGGRGAQPSPRT